MTATIRWFFWVGMILTLVGLILCIITGLHDHLRNITIPGAQVGAMMVVVGITCLGRFMYLDWKA